MPLFEYRCNECGRKFTMLVGVTAEKAKLRCPKCGATKATKLISLIARVARQDDSDDFDDSSFDDAGGDLGEEGDLDEDADAEDDSGDF